jgi:hypothetical protein
VLDLGSEALPASPTNLQAPVDEKGRRSGGPETLGESAFPPHTASQCGITIVAREALAVEADLAGIGG